MKYEEALNKMHNYGLDEEGEEAIVKLSEAIEVLRILKKYSEWFGQLQYVLTMAKYWEKEHKDITEKMLKSCDFPFSVDEFNAIVKWLEEEE